VRLLSQLHELIREGNDETPEGEALRDRMDAPGCRLSPAEVASVNSISADFYSLATPPNGPALPQTAEAQADLKAALQAQDRKDFNTALELLRKRGDFIDPAVLSYVRGSIWGEAGEDRIAIQFFRRAARLEPSNANYNHMALHYRSGADVEAARVEARHMLLSP
jgi:hypothetical protein